MPQLDRVIIFPQIFWFFLIFILFYALLTHYFLPKFLVSLKLRKYILKFNYLLINNKINVHTSVKLKLLNQLVLHLHQINKSIYINSNYLKDIKNDSKLVNSFQINRKLIKIIKNNVLFCNKNVLNLISFYPSNLNLKKLK